MTETWLYARLNVNVFRISVSCMHVRILRFKLMTKVNAYTVYITSSSSIMLHIVYIIWCFFLQFRLVIVISSSVSFTSNGSVPIAMEAYGGKLHITHLFSADYVVVLIFIECSAAKK
jgi:hypothetical protein